MYTCVDRSHLEYSMIGGGESTYRWLNTIHAVVERQRIVYGCSGYEIDRLLHAECAYGTRKNRD